jgi:hypothetical protein
MPNNHNTSGLLESAVCTLFEGNYHFGVAALINSLCKYEFAGHIYAGYRGELPFWCSKARDNSLLHWPNAKILEVKNGVYLNLLPVDTEYHFTNYKPFFMLRVWDTIAQNAKAMVYFDPDIVIKCKWDYFVLWTSYGVALVHEIISNDMPPSHPLRREWEKVILKAGYHSERELYAYINGGFCGVNARHKDFLLAWCKLTETANSYFGLTKNQWKHSLDRTHMFYAQDQDLLNITAMCSPVPISEMGPEAMDFIHGGFTMSHCVGSPKSWNKNFMLSVLQGFPPSLADRAYWENVNTPIRPFDPVRTNWKHLTMLIAAFIGRFHRRF